MRVAVILVGDELLAGHTRDANAHYIAQRLSALGHRLRHISVVPDEPKAISAEVDHLMSVAEVIFISGGLGPTHDDRTTESLANHFHRALVVDEGAWQKVMARYGHRPDVTERHRDAARKMVTVPEGVEILDNPVGAACGYVLREENVAFVILPGVPAELQAIFETHVVGKVLPVGARGGLVEVDLELPEAAFAEALSAVAERFGDIEIGSYPHFGEKRVTLRFKGDPERAREALEAFLDAQPDARASIVRGP